MHWPGWTLDGLALIDTLGVSDTVSPERSDLLGVEDRHYRPPRRAEHTRAVSQRRSSSTPELRSCSPSRCPASSPQAAASARNAVLQRRQPRTRDVTAGVPGQHSTRHARCRGRRSHARSPPRPRRPRRRRQHCWKFCSGSPWGGPDITPCDTPRARCAFPRRERSPICARSSSAIIPWDSRSSSSDHVSCQD
jgi:hypothetical protein